VAAALSGKKIVISTATKTLQTQILEREIPLVSRALGRTVSAALLKGRENYLCLRRYKRYTSQHLLRFAGRSEVLEEWAGRTQTGDREEIEGLPEEFDIWGRVAATSDTCRGQKCRHFEDCFLQARRKAAQRAQIVVVNHHLFFADLAVRSESAGEVIPRYSAIIFDEAHHLETVATQYFGVRLNSHRVAELVRDAGTLEGAKASAGSLAETVDAVARAAENLWTVLAPEEGALRLHDGLDGEAGKRLTHLAGAVERWIERIGDIQGGAKGDESSDIEALVRRARTLLGELRLFAEPPPSGEVRWVETRGKGVFLHSVPVDVGPVLAERLFARGAPVVLTTATLRVGGEFSYIRNRLGVPETAKEFVAESPFDYPRQCLIYVPRDMPDPNTPEFPRAVVDTLMQILGASRGRAFCLFTSHRILRLTAQGLRGQVPYRLLVQGDAPRDTLLRSFREDVSSVLLGAQAFWEGVDVPGEALSAVIIDRLPFSSPGDPLVEARVEKILERGGSPFREYQLPVAAMALRQGVGRLIRRPDDRGVIVILDVRIMARSYGSFLRKSLPPAPITRDFSELESFFTA
jgi:ATP-dependent DNA helicase DinG